MGRGIAQVAATGGMRVLLFDTRTEAMAEAQSFIAGMLRRSVEKKRMASEDAEAAIARLETPDTMEALAACDIVVEAVLEEIDVKRAVFAQLEDIVRDDAILTSNTSSLSITEIAAKCRIPERVAGFHFFNPVPLMALVEIIPGLRTRPDVVDTLMAVGKQMGRDPVKATDTPGFLVNHAGRAFVPEALNLVQEQIAGHHDIDRIMRKEAGFRMGPFELLDMVGADIALAVMESIYNQYFQEPMYRPVALLSTRVAGGLLGRKTGEGFYRYADGKPVPPSSEPLSGDAPKSIWVSDAEPEAARRVRDLLTSLKVKPESGERPSDDALCIVTPIGETAHATALEHGLDPARTVAIDTMVGLERHRTLMPTIMVPTARSHGLAALLASDGADATICADAPGFIAPRIIAMIVNVGCAIAAKAIATPADIDKAVRLGLNYPKGPLEFGDALGADTILRMLNGLHTHYGDPRYRPVPWLRERALLGLPLAESSAS